MKVHDFFSEGSIFKRERNFGAVFFSLECVQCEVERRAMSCTFQIGCETCFGRCLNSLPSVKALTRFRTAEKLCPNSFNTISSAKNT